MFTVMKELASEGRVFHKRHLRMSNLTSFGLYSYIGVCPLIDFIALCSFRPYIVLIILIFLPAQSVFNSSVLVPSSNFTLLYLSHFCSHTYSFQHFVCLRTFRMLKDVRCRRNSICHAFCEHSQSAILTKIMAFQSASQ
jgi:hypothetical protein